MKFGKIKKQHGRLKGLDDLLERIAEGCPLVSRIVPGRIKVRRGVGAPLLKLQYATPTGLKLLYLCSGSVQEVFLSCHQPEEVAEWLLESALIPRR